MASSVDPTLSTISVSHEIVETGVDTDVTVTAKDADNKNLGADLTVVISSTGTGNTVTQAEGGVTDADGVAVGAVKSTVQESKKVSAVVDGVDLTSVATFSVNNQVYPSVSADPSEATGMSTVPAYDPASPYGVLRYGEPMMANPNRVMPMKGWSTIDVSATLAYDDTGLQVDHPYVYRVRATDDDGNFIGYTESVEARTLAEDTASAPEALGAFPPWKIAAAGVSTTGISLAWVADVAEVATQFEIQRK